MSSCPASTVAAAFMFLAAAALPAVPAASTSSAAHAASTSPATHAASTSPATHAASASVHPDLWPAAAPAPADTATEAFVEQLLAHMSLEEKVGQMIQADIASISPAELRTYKLGSILAGGNAAPGDNVHSTPQAWLNLCDDYYRAALSATVDAHPPIPILFGIDAVHGHAKVVGATIFPHNVGLGAAHDADLVRRIGEATAEEVSATGIELDVRADRGRCTRRSLGPILRKLFRIAAIGGRIRRGHGHRPTGSHGTPQFMSPGHTLSSVKHFLGDGGTLGGRDQGDSVVSEAELSARAWGGVPGGDQGRRLDRHGVLQQLEWREDARQPLFADRHIEGAARFPRLRRRGLERSRRNSRAAPSIGARPRYSPASTC